MKDLKAMTDEMLVKLYMSGADEAFDILLGRYKDKLYNYLSYSVKNSDVADDLFQETFVKAIMHIRNGKYAETGKFYAWLTRIAHNLVIDLYRTEHNEKTISNDESETDLYESACLNENYNLENDAISEQTLNDVKDLMKYLPNSQREVLEMRYYQDLSFKEISKLTGVSINTALGRMRYAILNMRRLVTEYKINLY